MFAYLDAQNNVIGLSTKTRTLVQAQSRNSEIQSILANVPVTLIFKGKQSLSGSYSTYHRHTSGDGTSLSHYTEVEYLDPEKLQRISEIDLKTSTRILSGLAFDGKIFSMSLAAQNNWLALYVFKDTFTWPKVIPTVDDEAYSLDLGDLGAFVGAGKDLVEEAKASGLTLKRQILEASTKAELDAVVDNRYT